MDDQNTYGQEAKTYTNTRYMYVNSVAVATGDNDFVLRAETNLPDGLGEDVELLMSPRIAKLVRNALNDAVKDYEDIVGEIYMGNKVLEKYGSIEDEQNNE